MNQWPFDFLRLNLLGVHKIINFRETEMFKRNSVTDETLLTKEGHYNSGIHNSHFSMTANDAVKNLNTPFSEKNFNEE